MPSAFSDKGKENKREGEVKIVALLLNVFIPLRMTIQPSLSLLQRLLQSLNHLVTSPWNKLLRKVMLTFFRMITEHDYRRASFTLCSCEDGDNGGIALLYRYARCSR